MITIHRRHFISVLVLVVLLCGIQFVQAWTGPSASPPSSNVSAPVNVGSSDQVKNAGLSVNALAVFGNSAMTGNVTAAGFFHSSDARLKENIETINGLALVKQLRGVSFDWKASGQKSNGVIAQEVEAVLPEAVHTDASGMKSVEYDQLIGVLIEAVKAQQTEIEILKSELESLKQN